MSKKINISINIDCEFGSDFQKESALSSLELMIKSWKYFRLTTHQKNDIKVKYLVDGEEHLLV